MDKNPSKILRNILDLQIILALFNDVYEKNCEETAAEPMLKLKTVIYSWIFVCYFSLNWIILKSFETYFLLKNYPTICTWHLIMIMLLNSKIFKILFGSVIEKVKYKNKGISWSKMFHICLIQWELAY